MNIKRVIICTYFDVLLNPPKEFNVTISRHDENVRDLYTLHWCYFEIVDVSTLLSFMVWCKNQAPDLYFDVINVKNDALYIEVCQQQQ